MFLLHAVVCLGQGNGTFQPNLSMAISYCRIAGIEQICFDGSWGLSHFEELIQRLVAFVGVKDVAPFASVLILVRLEHLSKKYNISKDLNSGNIWKLLQHVRMFYMEAKDRTCDVRGWVKTRVQYPSEHAQKEDCKRWQASPKSYYGRSNGRFWLTAVWESK